MWKSALENYADDTLRLVLADLLRESDDPDSQARGRFLWAGVTSSHFRDDGIIDDPLYYTAQQEIAAIAAAGHLPRWLAALGIAAGSAKWVWDCSHDRVTVRIGTISAIFTRGMLSGLSMRIAAWYAVAETVLAAAPIETVSISDVRGLSLAIEQRDALWRLSARLKLPPQRISLMGGVIPTSVSPTPVLVETDRDWRADVWFTSRHDLCRSIVPETKSLVQTLKEAASA